MAESVPPAKVKKKAFPILADFKPEAEGAPATAAFKGEILQLAEQGLMAETTNANLHAGERFTVTFELPIAETEITELVRIIKVYSKPAGDPAQRRWIIEAHYVRAQATTVTHVATFLRKLERKSP